MKKYVARLTGAEREEWNNIAGKGKTQAHTIKHAIILLTVDAKGPALESRCA